MSALIHDEVRRIANDLRAREAGVTLDEADLLDELDRWLLGQRIAEEETDGKRGYYADGTNPAIRKGRRLPSVTGVLKSTLGFSKEALTRWAAREAASACAEFMLDGAALHDAVQRARYAPFDKRDTAADAGTLAHAMIDAFLRGVEFDDDPFVPSATMKAARGALDRFRRWFDPNVYEVIRTEWPLIDQVNGYGGRLDSVFRRRSDGALILGDLKTGKGIYDEAIVQLGGYALLMGNVEKLWPKEGLLMHFPLEGEGRVVPVSPEVLNLGAQAFTALFFVHVNRKHITIEKEETK